MDEFTEPIPVVNVELEVSTIDVDREKDYSQAIDRVIQGIDSFRGMVGADDDAEVVERRITLPLPNPVEIRIESRGQGRISITTDVDGRDDEETVSYDADVLSYQRTRHEPLVMQPDLRGIQVADYIFSTLQAFQIETMRSR